MSKSFYDSSVDAGWADVDCAAESSNHVGCPDRRLFLGIVVGAGFAVSPGDAQAQENAAVKNSRPQAGDRFAFVSGDKEGTEIKPADIESGNPVLAWPVADGKARDGSRLNQVLICRVDPSILDDETKPMATEDGIVAYSGTCTHAQCPVNKWNAEKNALHCACHQSEFAAGQRGKVVGGPAPRALPALPIKIQDGVLMAAGPFTGRVGAGK
jgi:rieske iron-sulfur protein